MTEEALRWERWRPTSRGERPQVAGLVDDVTEPGAAQKNAILLRQFGMERRDELGLDPRLPIRINRIQASTSQQFDRAGTPRTEFKFQVLQQRLVALDPNNPDSPKFVFRGGSTVVLDGDGRLRYLIGKRIASEARLKRQRDFLVDGLSQAAAAGYRPGLVSVRSSLAALHRGL
jgi:hypothetical protein